MIRSVLIIVIFASAILLAEHHTGWSFDLASYGIGALIVHVSRRKRAAC